MGYCDPINGLPTGMPCDVRNNIQNQAAEQRAADAQWLQGRHLGKAVRSRAAISQLEEPTLGTLADLMKAA